jgi:hypothetical protein
MLSERNVFLSVGIPDDIMLFSTDSDILAIPDE